MVDQIDADGVVLEERRDLDLRAYPIGAGDQNRFPVAAEGNSPPNSPMSASTSGPKVERTFS